MDAMHLLGTTSTLIEVCGWDSQSPSILEETTYITYRVCLKKPKKNHLTFFIEKQNRIELKLDQNQALDQLESILLII